ncbi:MAG: hypothetical protein EOP49_04820, partial [Sphingobacteriales bacterium]
MVAIPVPGQAAGGVGTIFINYFQKHSIVMDQIYLYNKVGAWLMALGTLLACAIATWLFRQFVISKIKQWTSKTSNTWDDFLITLLETSIIPFI